MGLNQFLTFLNTSRIKYEYRPIEIGFTYSTNVITQDYYGTKICYEFNDGGNLNKHFVMARNNG